MRHISEYSAESVEKWAVQHLAARLSCSPKVFAEIVAKGGAPERPSYLDLPGSGLWYVLERFEDAKAASVLKVKSEELWDLGFKEKGTWEEMEPICFPWSCEGIGWALLSENEERFRKHIQYFYEYVRNKRAISSRLERTVALVVDGDVANFPKYCGMHRRKIKNYQRHHGATDRECEDFASLVELEHAFWSGNVHACHEIISRFDERAPRLSSRMLDSLVADGPCVKTGFTRLYFSRFLDLCSELVVKREDYERLRRCYLSMLYEYLRNTEDFRSTHASWIKTYDIIGQMVFGVMRGETCFADCFPTVHGLASSIARRVAETRF